MKQTTIFDFLNQQYKITKPIRLIELFAGIGSQAKALSNLGIDFEHWFVCEFDKYAIKSYNAIHNTNFETSDVTKITAKDLNIVDTDKYTYLLTYSFPCQDLSLAGKQAGMEKNSGTRSGLLWEVERLLNECTELPQILLMENVPQVHGSKNKVHFDKWIEFLESKGYKNYWQDLNAKNYGIPQNRNRCFMVSVLDHREFEFPQPFELKLRLKDMLENEVDKKYFLSDYWLDKLANKKYKIDRYKVDTLNLIKGIYSQFAILDCRLDEGLRIRKNNLCPTLTTRGKGQKTNVPIIYQDHKLRFITEKESWRLVGFSDTDYDKAAQFVSNSQLYKQAGNSIVVDVLENIFKQFL